MNYKDQQWSRIVDRSKSMDPEDRKTYLRTWTRWLTQRKTQNNE